MINYALIGETLLHPTKRAILAVFDDGDEKQIWSPTGLAEEIDEPLGNVSYHVKDLAGIVPPRFDKPSRFADKPLLVLVDTRPRRGALEHFYALAPRARAVASKGEDSA